MAAASNLILSSLQAGTTLVGAGVQANAFNAQGDYQKQQFETNARLAEDNAADALRRGSKLAGTLHGKTARSVGQARASYAAQGVDVSSGSAADVQGDIETMGQLDELTAKNNAWKEAYGFKTEALQSRGKGTYAQLAAGTNAANTILTGGIKAFGDMAPSLNNYFNPVKAKTATTPGKFEPEIIEATPGWAKL